jgi:hypothetical protein
MNRAAYVLIGLWVLLPTVFYVMLRLDKRKRERPTSKRDHVLLCVWQPPVHAGTVHAQPGPVLSRLREMV